MKDWLSEQGLQTDTLGKKAVASLLKTAPDNLREVLALRQQLAKSSVKKYQAMQNAVCADGRARGMFQFYGANRTGRWAGRLIQMQNLPQNHLPDLEQARELVRIGDYEAVKMLYEDVPDTLSQLIRTAFVARPGAKFIVADFSAIEARVIAWLAGEEWRQEVFAEGKDIYCASASQMFGVPVEKHGINGHLRQKGKIAELALGYGGSVGALKAMGAIEMGLSEDELQPLVQAWRDANPNIVRFWWAVDSAAMNAVSNKTTDSVYGIEFTYKSGMLFITLPSGRKLTYVKPAIGENQFGSPCVTYEGVGGTKKWERLASYGPKFVENIVQATARDILCYSMKTLRNTSMVMHIHDEIVIEADKRMSLEAVCEQMGRTPPWAQGLLLRADGYETTFYRKD
jgi:DNA polymerase